jgi:hypothetical protein
LQLSMLRKATIFARDRTRFSSGMGFPVSAVL